MHFNFNLVFSTPRLSALEQIVLKLAIQVKFSPEDFYAC